MSIFRRRLFNQQGEEPLYEKEVEYLQTDGNQYFSLPISASEATDAFEITFRATTDTAQMRFCYGGNGAFHLYGNNSKRMAYSRNTTWNYMVNSNYCSIGTVKHTCKVDYLNKRITYDCFTASWTSASTRESTTNLYVTKPYTNSSGTTYLFKGLIYSVKFWRNGNLLYDLVPVRKRGVGYFFDKLNDVLYANEGTGNWTIGQDKLNDINYYNVVDYISTSGTASGYSQPYIDTGIGSADGNIQMTMVAKWNTLATARTQYFGTITSASTSNNHPWFGCSGNTYISNSGVTYPEINPPSTTAYTTFTMNQYSPTLTGQNVAPITLFRTYYVCDRKQTNSKQAHVASCKLKSFQITVDGVLVRNFVPVRHPISNRYGMFDLVENKFYDSANSTAFQGGYD